MERYLTLDTAYYSPTVFEAARQLNTEQATAGRPERVLGIFFYLFDPWANDVNGYCGGWTPAVVQEIWDRGYVPLPIVTMRPAVAGGMLTPAEIAAALARYPVLAAHPVHIKVTEDQEDGSFTGAAWSQELARAMPVELYGSSSTVLSDYAAGVAAIWVGNYPGIPVLPPPDLARIPGVPDTLAPDARAWQYVGSALIAGAEVDVSISNVPLEGDPMASLILSEDEQRELLTLGRDAKTVLGWLDAAINGPAGLKFVLPAKLDAITAQLNAIPSTPGNAAALKALQDDVKALRDGFNRLEAALRQA